MKETIERALSALVEPEMYWAVKGIGRILLIVAIAVYGIGLIMSRISKERAQAICERDGETISERKDDAE